MGARKTSWKLALLVLAATSAAVFLVFLLVSNGYFSSDNETIRYFLSSVFQGLAAFLGIVLVMLGIEYGRSASARNNAQVQLESYASELGINTSIVTDVKDFDEALKGWHKYRYPGLLEEASYLTDIVREKGFDEKSYADVERLVRQDNAYYRAGRRLGRFYVENKYFKNLPFATAVAMLPAAVTVVVSGIVLACLEPLAYDLTNNHPVWLTAPIALMLLISVISVFGLLYLILSRLAKEDYGFWFEESKLPDLKELDGLLEVMTEKFTEFTKAFYNVD